MLKIMRNCLVAGLLLIITACAAGGGNPFVGTWDTVATSPLGDQAAVWIIAADGSGVMSTELGDQTVDGILVNGNSVSFDLVIDGGGQSIALSFSGVVTSDTLTGAFDSDFGEFAVSGARR
ncbi:MAG: hypothetical protein WDZ52_10110 [Pseudohongiellaceae bacterium]